MAELLFWGFGLQAMGAPLEFIAMEQSSRLPQQILDDIRLELRGGQETGEWYFAEHRILEAAHFGLASRRERVYFLAARRFVQFPIPAPEQAPTAMAEALGRGEGERVNTRGTRPVDPATGRAKGGNTFSADQPSWCLTGKARGWYRESDGLRLTPAQAGLLVAFLAEHPWQGSRSSAFQQAADVVSPVMSAVVLGSVLRVVWEPRVRDYLTGLYGTSDRTADYDLTV